MAETDGIDEAAEQILRTATMTATQVIEQLARTQQQRLRGGAGSTHDGDWVSIEDSRDRDRVDRAIAKVESTATQATGPALRTAFGPVDRLLAAERATNNVNSRSTARTEAVRNSDQPESIQWDDPGRRTAFRAELEGVADREAVAARLRLDRSRAHPATTVTGAPLTSEHTFGKTFGAHLSVDVGR